LTVYERCDIHEIGSACLVRPLRSYLQRLRMERSNLAFNFFLCEGAGETIEGFLRQISANCFSMENTRRFGIKYDGRAMWDLKPEFWVAGEVLRTFEKDLEMRSRTWCLDSSVVGIVVVVWRRSFCLEVIEVDMGH